MKSKIRKEKLVCFNKIQLTEKVNFNKCNSINNSNGIRF